MNEPVIHPFQTVDDYRSAPALKFPWSSARRSFAIDEADFSCDCGEPLVDVRGYIVDNGESVDLDVAGVCPKCRLVVVVSMKIFPEQGIALHHKGDDHWAVLRFSREPDVTPAPLLQ